MMRISQIEIENFKAFKGNHTFNIGSNLVFLVGDNNAGKTSLFEAVSFVKSGLPNGKKIEDLKNQFAATSEHMVCTIKMTGNLREVIANFSESKYESFVFEEGGQETLLVRRSSEEKTITQSGKVKNLTIKTVTVWNPASSQFENPTGVDTMLGSLFETQFIWADCDPTDVSDFGSTKICGRLLSGAVGDFFEGAQWQRFAEIHEETFHGSGDCLSKRTEAVEGRIGGILREQYGNVSVKFNFSLPEPSTFYKAGDIRVHDGVETRLDEKGTGLQRAVALAMIQVYAQNITLHPTDPNQVKPLFFFVDEPEIGLHPRAQTQLMKAFVSLSESQQIFVSTHSPYLLKTFDRSSHDLLAFERDLNGAKLIPAKQMKLFGWSPSWGEINYQAYKLPTLEFHDELYGALHEKYISTAPNAAEAKRRSELSTLDFDLLAGGDPTKQVKNWSRLKNGIQQPPSSVTTSTFIRNRMHHPESRQTDEYSDAEFAQSIVDMIALLETI